VDQTARLAVALDGNNANAHACLSVALFLRGDHQGALVEGDRALALSPNLASGYWRRGQALIFSGRPLDGVGDLKTSLRLEPRGVNLAQRLTQMAEGYYFSRAYDEAFEAAKHVIRSFPDFPPPYRTLAGVLGQLGRIEEAKEALKKALALAPAYFEMYVRQCPPWQRPEDHAHLLEGLRKAGWQG
jgi:adenylate cyclase